MDSRPPNLQLLLLLTSLLHFWQCASGQSSYIIDTIGLTLVPSSTVTSGTPVTLRCQVSVSHDNIPHLTHTFQFTRDDTFIYSFTTTEDSVVYELNPATAADSGSYECRVTVKDKSKASFSQNLDVTGLQTPILYLNKTSPYESEEFIATCSAPEEKGSLIFRFYQRFRSGESRKIKQAAPTGNSLETTLVLRHIGDSFLYCDYEINLVSGARSSNRSNDIQVIVKALHISPVMNVLPSPEVFEGDVMEVVCKVVNTLKNIEVFLTTDRKILKQAPVSLNHRFTAQEGDSGEFVCKAEWGNVQKETYQTITVKELFSKPRLTVEPIHLFHGDTFKLTCSVSIYVPEKINKDPMQFSIYKDNVKLTSAKTLVTVADSKTNGNYTCKAQAASLTQSFVKDSQTVVVRAKVPVSDPMLSVVGGMLVLGKRFQLLCSSANGTLPITYNLYSPDKRTQQRVVSRPGEQAVFNSSAIYKKSDLDTFICHANNGPRPPVVGTGQQMQRSTNIIEPVSKPVLTMVPSMGDISEGQDLTLVCLIQRGTLPISFTWYHTDTEGALASHTSMKLEGSYKINNVRGEHRGGYYCVSTNPANETKQSQTVIIGVKLAGWKKGLIAVFCILLILALIIVITFKRRLLRFKRNSTGKLSVKSASTKAERLSLTQVEVNETANVTPGMMGKSIWSEHVSGSDPMRRIKPTMRLSALSNFPILSPETTESDDHNSVTSPEKPEPEYTEVQTRQADPNRAPLKKGSDTVYSEVQNSMQGVPEQGDGQGSVEYAQLNHDENYHSDNGIHGDHSVQDDHTQETDNSVDNNTADHGE